MQYYVYLMTNQNKTVLYTGVTNDLIRRIYEHKHHLDKSSFTSRYNVEYLVYYETTADVEAAIEREKQIKGWNRKRKEKLIQSKNPDWIDLYNLILQQKGIATPVCGLVRNDILIAELSKTGVNLCLTKPK